MLTCDRSRRAAWMTFLVLLAAPMLGQSQTPALPPTGDVSNTYRIAGTIVSKVDGHALTNARVTVQDAKDPKKSGFVITSEDGKYEFHGLPPGKYSLTGAKRGFLTAAYDQHDEFSTAIVTGAGLDTEHLILKLTPNAVLTGKVLDETGEPVRNANVTLYFNDHGEGVDQVHVYRMAQTNDLGVYEITQLRTGTYFLSASAKPWYAVHPPSGPSNAQADGGPWTAQSVDRSLDVAYPVTYYPDVTDAESAMPVPIQGGEHMQIDIHLDPVPSLHLKFRVRGDNKMGYPSPQLQQSAFDVSTFVQADGTWMVSPGVWELTGVPAGRYNIQVQSQEGGGRIDGVDLTKDGDEVDATAAEAFSDIKVSVQVPGETSLPKQLAVGMRRRVRLAAGYVVDAEGKTEFKNVPAGQYEMVAWGGGKRYSVARMTAEGAKVSGHKLTVAPGTAISVSLTLIAGTVTVQGTAKKAGKGFAGAMVVLVPKDPERNRDLFRRDQSDLDGTFNLANVVPGGYNVVAIENGWDLDWSQPNVIAAYAKRGQAIEVGNQRAQNLVLADPVEVLSK